MKKRLILILLAAVALASCTTSKQTTMDDLRALSTEIEQNAQTYNFQQWLQMERKYNKITSKLDKHSLTEEEQREVGEIKGLCLGYFAKGIIGKASNKISELNNHLQGVFDGLQKALKP